MRRLPADVHHHDAVRVPHSVGHVVEHHLPHSPLLPVCFYHLASPVLQCLPLLAEHPRRSHHVRRPSALRRLVERHDAGGVLEEVERPHPLLVFAPRLRGDPGLRKGVEAPGIVLARCAA